MPVVVPMAMAVPVMVVATGRPHAEEVDAETDAGHEQKLLGAHLGRVHAAVSAYQVHSLQLSPLTGNHSLHSLDTLEDNEDGYEDQEQA